MHTVAPPRNLGRGGRNFTWANMPKKCRPPWLGDEENFSNISPLKRCFWSFRINLIQKKEKEKENNMYATQSVYFLFSLKEFLLASKEFFQS